MLFSKAMAAYEQGQKIRHEDWIDGFYISKIESNVVSTRFGIDELNSDKWEVLPTDKDLFSLTKQLLVRLDNISRGTQYAYPVDLAELRTARKFIECKINEAD